MNQDLAHINPLGIRKFFSLASKYDHVLSLTIGEPDFTTPYHIAQAAIASINQGKTYYSPIEGLLALREQISHYMKRKFELSYDPQNQILVTVGASEGIDLAIRALCNPDDEVIVVQPSFVSYVPLVQLAKATPVIAHTQAKDNFKLTPELLASCLSDKTKLIIISYPNNPTGAIMTLEDYQNLVPVLKDYNGYILSDEIYAELNYSDHAHASFAQVEGFKDKTIILSGFSKAYAMTGWRLGYACGASEIIDYMTRIHQYGIMCPPTAAQFGAIEAMNNGDEGITKMRDSYNQRRRYLLTRLNEIGLTPIPAQGAFYIFASIKSTGLTSEEFSEQLIDQQRVAVIPGNAFGESGEGYVRISYSYGLAHIKEACDKIEAFVLQFKQ